MKDVLMTILITALVLAEVAFICACAYGLLTGQI